MVHPFKVYMMTTSLASSTYGLWASFHPPKSMVDIEAEPWEKVARTVAIVGFFAVLGPLVPPIILFKQMDE
jgi:hypothetical protein